MAHDDPVDIPRVVFERVSALCLALPEVTVRFDQSRVEWRSAAYSFDVRRRSFCLLIATADTSGTAVPRIVLRVHPDDRDTLVSIGHPYYPSRAGPDRVAVLLTSDTDWTEIGELITESYRLLAPKKLAATLDTNPTTWHPRTSESGA